MIIVTGASGFIGSRLIKGLNQKGINNIIAVDDLTDGHKFQNLIDLEFKDYIDKDEFLVAVVNNLLPDNLEAIFHQGACSQTTEWNGKFLMQNNYEYSKTLFHFCQDHKIPFYYASSAAIYGSFKTCKEQPQYEKPLNAYGYSKLIFDHYVRHYLDKLTAPVVGLRYFNVYGPNEIHKGAQKSVVAHFYELLQKYNRIDIFKDCEVGLAPGEQRRDFVYVEDCIDVNLWLLNNPSVSGIFNCGTGHSLTFNTLAKIMVEFYGSGDITYTTIPEHLKKFYQIFTEADMSLLRKAGYTKPFRTVQESIGDYLMSKNTALHESI